jgi:hypothetical protein
LNNPAQESLAAAVACPEEIEGLVIRKEWSKTYESWDAGGSEYYVIQLDRPCENHKTMILRPSDSVVFESFELFAGKRVAVRGSYMEPKPYVPQEGSMEPYPMRPASIGSDRMVPAPRGSGFKVQDIQTID